MKRIAIISLVLIAGLFSCKDQKGGLDKYSWLLGNWKTIKGTSTYESWKAENDTLYTGTGYRLYGTDTIISEYLKLVKRGDRFIYSASVPDQNKGRTVSFWLVSNTADSIVFENPNHDFPNRITYMKIGSDKMKTIITGFQQRRDIFIDMERVP